MSKWNVEFKERVKKREVPKLPKDVKLILDAAIVDLEDEGPHPYGWNVDVFEKGKNRMWLKHKWRIVYKHDKTTKFIEITYAGSKENVPY